MEKDERIKRIRDEEALLDENIKKLAKFLDGDIPKEVDPIQISLLKIQFKAMLTYSECLAERLKWF